jgi:ferrous iron transport protein A
LAPVRYPVDPDTDLIIQQPAETLASLADGRRGFAGVIAEVEVGAPVAGGLAAKELERRLLEMGFVEGARVEILHEGFIGRDPICVRLDDMRVALRRRDARGILVRADRSRADGTR